MANVNIFIDDFNVEIRPGSWGQYGTSYGFVAAIVHAGAQQQVEHVLSNELAVAKAAGVRADELHGADIVNAKKGWREITILERVEVLKRVLGSAKTADVHFIWELVQDGRPEFGAVRSAVVSALQARIPEDTLRRLSPDGDPQASIVTVVLRQALLYAALRMGATAIEVQQDEGIPRVVQLETVYQDRMREGGCYINLLPNAKSHQVPGLQLADLAATTLGIGFKVSRKIDELKETATYPDGDPFDAFSRVFFAEDVLPLLETRLRTHRAVDLHFNSEDEATE